MLKDEARQLNDPKREKLGPLLCELDFRGEREGRFTPGFAQSQRVQNVNGVAYCLFAELEVAYDSIFRRRPIGMQVTKDEKATLRLEKSINALIGMSHAGL